MGINNSAKAWSNYVMSKAQTLVDIIRKRKVISFGELCSEGHIAPSTLYSYKKIILAKFPDIEFDGQNFKVKA